MSSRQKNTFNDRLKRLGCEELQKQFRNKNKAKTMLSETFNQSPSPHKLADSKTSAEIFDQMRREIISLTHRLHEADAQRQKWEEELEFLTARLGEREMQSAYLAQQLAESQKMAEAFKQQLESAESELENLRLRQKMEAISLQLSKQQTTASPLKHQRHKKGKFSAAVLPSAFGSQKKFQFRNTQLFRDQSSVEFAESQSILRNPFSGYLIEEWQRSKQQRNCKQLQVASLQSKLAGLRKEIAKQNKEIETLRTSRPSSNQLVAALEENRQQERRNKIIFMKLRESEKKRKEMSVILKEKGENLEQQKFYGYSTLADINQMIEKEAENLQIESSVLQISLNNLIEKMPYQTQTQSINTSTSQINSLQILIQQLTSQIVSKQQQFKAKFQQMKAHYESQIQEYLSELQDYRIQIQENNIIISRYEYQNQENYRPMKSIAIDCQLIQPNHKQQQEIIQKVKVLMEVNEQLAQQLKKSQIQIHTLTQEIQMKKKSQKCTIERETQVEEHLHAVDDNEDVEGPSCQRLRHQIYQHKEEMSRLNRIIVNVNNERDHFKHCYQQSLTSSKYIQNDMLSESTKLRHQNQQKEHALKMLSAQLEQRSNQIDRYRHDVSQLQGRLHELEELKQKLEHELLLDSSNR